MKSKKLLIGLYIAVLASSCVSPPGTRYDVYDAEVCGDLGSAGAHCNHLLTNAPRDIPKPLWDQMRVGYLCMDSQAYTDRENLIEQFCNNTQSCDYKTREIIRTLSEHLAEIIARTKRH